MADLDRIKRNVEKMAGMNAPTEDIDGYIASEGVTIDQVRAHKMSGLKPTGVPPLASGGDQPTKSGGGFWTQFAGNIPRGVTGTMDMAETFGPMAPARLLKEAIGQKSYLKQFDDSPFAPPDPTNSTERWGATLGDFVGGSVIPGGGWIGGARSLAAAPMKEASSYIGRMLQRAAQETAKHPYKSAGFDLASALTGGTAKHLAEESGAGPLGATMAAIAGGMAPAAPSLLSASPLGSAYRYMTGRGEAARGNVAARAGEWDEAGVRPFAPALTDNVVLKATGEGGAGSVFGSRLRQGAQGSIDDTLGQARALINTGTGGEPVNDAAAAIQGDLRRALIERTVPSEQIQRLPNAELEKITGPVGTSGFNKPRPVINPVEPEIPVVTPREIDPSEIPMPRVMPERIDYPKIKPQYTKVDDVPYPQGMQETLNRERMNLQIAEDQVESLTKAFSEEATRRGMDPEALFSRIAQQEATARLGVQLPRDPSLPVFEKLMEARKAADSVRSSYDTVMQSANDARAKVWQSIAKQEFTQQREAADAAWRAKVDAAKKEAERAAREQHEQQLAAARTKAKQEAEETRAKLEADARREADNQARMAQQRADAEWEAEVARAPGFKIGQSRESYPTEFAAAYERVTRETPVIQRNPLGGRGPSGSPYKTNLETLLDEFGLEGRRQGLVPGYKEGQLFTPEGNWAPAVGPYIDELVGPDVARRLNAYADKRNAGEFAPKIQGTRDFRTAVRQSAQDAERPPFPAQPRTREASALRRVEGAVTADMYRFMEEAGPKGQTAANMWRNVDREYATFIQELRKPLAKLYGTDVKPIEAMDRITKAATDGDLKTLRAFMRVMNEKGDPKRAATAVIANLTQNAETLPAFIQGLAKLPRESRAVVFGGQDGAHMLKQIEALERIGKRLMPYDRAMQGGVRIGNRGPDLTNPTNLAVGLLAASNFYAAAVPILGAAGIARFMASPKYMTWLTRGASLSSKPQVMAHLARLGRFVEHDNENLGPDMVKAVRQAVDISAHATMAGENAANLDTKRLEQAQRAQDDGADANDVWQKFGWYKGRDGGWRTELDDTPAKLKMTRGALMTTQGAKLGDVLEHADLFKAYPELADLPIRADAEPFRKKRGVYAHYSPERHEIVINPRAAFEDDGKAWDPVGVILHEVQHAISGREGFRYGDRAPYQRRPGEAEAMNVQNRRGLTAEQRQQWHPGRTMSPSEDKLDWRPDEDDHYPRQWGAERSRPAIRQDSGGARQSGQQAPFQIIIDAARRKGLDPSKASPQDVIDAAWDANPTDEMGELIDAMAEKYGLTPPWKRKK